MTRIYFDNSALSTFKECPRKFYLRHFRGWRKDGVAMPLVFGSSWHEAMDTVWSQWHNLSRTDLLVAAAKAFQAKWVSEGLPPAAELDMDQLERMAPRTPYTAMEMLSEYCEKRAPTFDNSSFSLEAVEQPFAVPIYPSRSDIWYIGRLDKVFNLNGSRIIGEHKTTTEYKKDGGFKTTYLEGWSPSSQIEGYLYAGNLYFDGGVRYVWIDAALVHKKEHGFYKFIPIAANLSALDGWLWEVRDWIETIQVEQEKLTDPKATNGDNLQCFRRNTDSCTGKYGACTFLEVCRNIDNPHLLEAPPEGYKVEFWAPFDLLGISKLGAEFTPPADNVVA